MSGLDVQNGEYMEAYLDNAATTKVSGAVMEKMSQVFLSDFYYG